MTTGISARVTAHRASYSVLRDNLTIFTLRFDLPAVKQALIQNGSHCGELPLEGGGHVIAVAADDPNIAAVVAQIQFNGFPKKVEGRSTAATLRLLGAMFKDTIRGWLGLSPHYIPVVGKEGEFAVMATSEVQQAIDQMQSVQWRNEVAPRVLFEMMRYKPGNMAYQLKMPLLVCIAENDREAPPGLACQIAENAPFGEFKIYLVAHFNFYQPDVRALVIKDQINFLRKHLMNGP